MPDASAPAPAFLGVERSLGGRRWTLRLADDRAALGLAQRSGLPEPLARVLAGRGVCADDAARFLEPTLRDLLPDPSHLKDMDAAAARLADAVQRGDAIAIFGDYDVDGATSAALLHDLLAAAGAPPRLYVPDRIREGYGPNAPALRRLAAEGAKLVVTVDCGTLAFAALDAGREAGLDVIVVDHHIAEPNLPAAVAVINPNRLDDSSPHRQLAAVGVAFLLAVAVNRELRRRGHWATRPEPDLLTLLDLVALGTVADVVPLTGLNRAFVRQGLAVMATRGRPGLVALADVAALKERPAAYHLGFVFGPRVNAGGRVGESDLGVRLLTTRDPALACDLAQRLDALNRERRRIEEGVLEQAKAQADSGDPAAPFLLVAGEGWHPGVIGIVAARLAERRRRPTAVVALAGATGKASARSSGGFDLGAAVIAARGEGLLIDGGGHRQAAGFTVAADALPALTAFLAGRAAAHAAGHAGGPTLALDGALGLAGAGSVDLAESLARAGPFGSGNPAPCFALPDARVAKADVVGQKHVRCFLTDGAGGRAQAIAFRAVGTPLGEALLARAGAPLHLAGVLEADSWNGERRARFRIEDAAAPG